jgi:hypothetical protein
LKRFNIILLLIILILLTSIFSVQALEYDTVTKMANDVNCRAVCHPQDPHVIHEKTSATCQGCHGATLTDKQPECKKCHTGTIHNVHIKKVQSEACSYCHGGELDKFHLNMMSNTVCAHCHGDLLVVHGGPDGIPVQSCAKCHGPAGAGIYAPVKAETDVIVCEACHKSTDVAILHGEASDANSCYRCHRPGSGNITATEIPHFIHVPKVECSKCHIEQNTGKIMIPQCPQCHDAPSLHGYNQIALKTPNTGLKCEVCHPTLAPEKPEEVTTTASSAPTATETGTAERKKTSGFGIGLAVAAVALIYMTRRR